MNILFVFAHPDDEAFGPAGTIAAMSTEHSVWVLSLCKGNRPNAEEVSSSRQQAFAESCKLLGATPIILDHSDAQLDYHAAMRDVMDVVNAVQPEIVYTHNISDIHVDHRVTAEVCQVACRPKPESSVKEFYMCELPASTDWAFNQLEPAFVPNVYRDVTEHMDTKRAVLALYDTETYEFPDARSERSMEVLAMNRGRQVGLYFAEAFKLVWKRC